MKSNVKNLMCMAIMLCLCACSNNVNLKDTNNQTESEEKDQMKKADSYKELSYCRFIFPLLSDDIITNTQ